MNDKEAPPRTTIKSLFDILEGQSRRVEKIEKSLQDSKVALDKANEDLLKHIEKKIKGLDFGSGNHTIESEGITFNFDYNAKNGEVINFIKPTFENID